LNHFVQETISDYSFAPPDRRFTDLPFFLPDFNATELSEKTVLFMVDTSGSINNDTLETVYSEICGAIEQFDGMLHGVMVFFDMNIYQPIAFVTVDDLSHITPKGGGGTDYHCVFEFLRKKAAVESVSSVVIITDGDAEIASSDFIEDLPLLWVLTKKEAKVPFGKSVYI